MLILKSVVHHLYLWMYVFVWNRVIDVLKGTHSNSIELNENLVICAMIVTSSLLIVLYCFVHTWRLRLLQHQRHCQCLTLHPWWHKCKCRNWVWAHSVHQHLHWYWHNVKLWWWRKRRCQVWTRLMTYLDVEWTTNTHVSCSAVFISFWISI